MRLIFYIFVFSQLFNLFDVFAEKIKKEPSELNIQWERFRDKKSNNLKIIWKSYNNDATLTIPFDVLGFSICSQIATRYPAFTNFGK